MPAIQRLLQHLGFVKLRRYGLELTSDGRVVSKRAAVLDDGTGGKIVGWQDGDVAIWKLQAWNEAAEVIPLERQRREDQDDRRERGALVPAKPVIPAASPVAQSPPRQPSAAVIPAVVAAEPQVDEDDWEWTIALARARVAVDEAEVARPPEPVRRAEPPRRAEAPVTPLEPPAPERPTPPLVVRPLVHPAPVLPPPDWAANGSTTGEYEDYRVSASRPAIEIPHVPPAPIARGSTPSTVIPVPPLPMVDAALCSRLEPVVRTAQTGTTTARLAKGTAPLDPPSASAAAVEDTIPNLSIGDRTTPGMAPPRRASAAEVAANGDRTKPGIAMPAAARAVELPSIKRRSGSPPR